jgi:hypothetical protein
MPALPVASAIPGAAGPGPHGRGLRWGPRGYVEGRNMTVEYRSANNDNDRLPELAADLVRRRVSILVVPGNLLPRGGQPPKGFWACGCA